MKRLYSIILIKGVFLTITSFCGCERSLTVKVKFLDCREDCGPASEGWVLQCNHGNYSPLKGMEVLFIEEPPGNEIRECTLDENGECTTTWDETSSEDVYVAFFYYAGPDKDTAKIPYYVTSTEYVPGDNPHSEDRTRDLYYYVHDTPVKFGTNEADEEIEIILGEGRVCDGLASKPIGLNGRLANVFAAVETFYSRMKLFTKGTGGSFQYREDGAYEGKPDCIDTVYPSNDTTIDVDDEIGVPENKFSDNQEIAGKFYKPIYRRAFGSDSKDDDFRDGCDRNTDEDEGRWGNYGYKGLTTEKCAFLEGLYYFLYSAVYFEKDSSQVHADFWIYKYDEDNIRKNIWAPASYERFFWKLYTTYFSELGGEACGKSSSESCKLGHILKALKEAQIDEEHPPEDDDKEHTYMECRNEHKLLTIWDQQDCNENGVTEETVDYECPGDYMTELGGQDYVSCMTHELEEYTFDKEKINCWHTNIWDFTYWYFTRYDLFGDDEAKIEIRRRICKELSGDGGDFHFFDYATKPVDYNEMCNF